MKERPQQVVRLTKRVIDALDPATKARRDYIRWDKDLKGFGVRVTDAGRKVFVIGYRPHGTRAFKRVTLGSYGTLTVDEARSLARKQLAIVANGGDPASTRRAAKDAPTVRELGADWLRTVHQLRKRSTALEYDRLWRKHVVPALGSTKVTRVTKAHVAKLHRSLHRTPYLANRALAILGAFFSYAIEQGERSQHDNPAHGIEPFRERGRERFLTPDELARLGEALAKAEREGLMPAPVRRRRRKSGATAKHRPRSADTPTPANPFAIGAIRFLLLSGWRASEALTLRWNDVDVAGRRATLGDTKTGRSHRTLSAPASALLDALPRIAGSPFVFPGRRTDRPLADIDRLWYAVRHAAELQDVRLHDLRHSFASVVASGGGSLLMIAALLGHRNTRTTQKYAHLLDDPVRSTADSAGTQIAAWLGSKRAVS